MTSYMWLYTLTPDHILLESRVHQTDEIPVDQTSSKHSALQYAPLTSDSMWRSCIVASEWDLILSKVQINPTICQQCAQCASFHGHSIWRTRRRYTHTTKDHGSLTKSDCWCSSSWHTPCNPPSKWRAWHLLGEAEPIPLLTFLPSKTITHSEKTNSLEIVYTSGSHESPRLL